MVSRNDFMHHHALLQNFNIKEYLCGGCKTVGNGMNFGCEPCSFHMHDFCSECPMILPSFLHPEHPLHLMISNPACPRICDVCEDTVEGLFYWCQTCNFNVHPLCTQFPQYLCHAVHHPYLLMFQKSYRNNPCCICKAVCNSWKYSCNGIDVHVECVAKLYEAKSYETTTRRLPPHAGLYTYGGVNSTANSYNIYEPPSADDQTTPAYDMNQCHPYGGGVSMHNFNGIVPPGTYGHQPNNFPPGTYSHHPNNFHGEMPVGTNSHNMFPSCSGSASGTYQNGTPLNTNSYNMCNPFSGSPSNTNSYSMYNAHNGAPFDSNSQHAQVHNGDTSHHAPAHNAQTSPAQSQGFVKLGSKIVFRILISLAIGMVTGVVL